ncbi:hypothetical protein PTSG_02946 [Salpingoeca rosetta]|uniref:Golgi apparatus membrane protein TVP23 homolog n=1 Tax=Salpingoeca rosetta (strain ATCC 50818 / BSB-021) TaxID=946362 RepID=F2U3T2_SALR5|nr:uncharacterized protein PTSG_02946 [Salpingoeca rosetta]EGD82276.1 hypothetical protein PTSG_02946 [Salpingoeca rosetta]|eukprot:XP_004996459.1 hypothetical protein PTSG_02946 [Salpingoeca rosetta]
MDNTNRSSNGLGGLAQGWRHPRVVFFHMLFKLGALLTYIFCTVFSSSFIINFIVITVLIACDFWMVKNVSGRFLVGLRWWNQIDDEGNSKWRFESRKGGDPPDASESRLFWWSLYIFTFIWGVLGFFALIRLRLSYLLVVVIAILLNSSNVVGYRKCQRNATNQRQDVASAYISSHITQSLTQAVTSQLFRGQAASNNNNNNNNNNNARPSA